jgi:CheY-like chemotaxis protein
MQNTTEAQPLRILLAEDSPDNVLIIKLYLKNYIQMPGMDGYEATERIRVLEEERGTGHTPIIAVTAHASEEIRKRVLDCGGDAYITKPVPKARLLEAIRAAVP